MNLYNRQFSHIFIEREAYKYPLCSSIIDNLNSSNIITIDNYQQIFSRKNQSFEFLKTFEAFYKIGLYSLKGSIEHFNEGCSILNISTDYINSPVTGFSHYISAKSAMEILFKGMQ